MLPVLFLPEPPGIAALSQSLVIPAVLLGHWGATGRPDVDLCPALAKSFTWSKEVLVGLLTEPKPNMNSRSLPNQGLGTEYQERLFSSPDEKADVKINFPP